MVARIRTGLKAVDTALEQVWRALENKLLGGVHLSGSLVAGTPKRFTHGMRRPWQGWTLTGTTGASPVHEANVTSTDKQSEIWLESAADTDVKIYLF